MSALLPWNWVVRKRAPYVYKSELCRARVCRSGRRGGEASARNEYQTDASGTKNQLLNSRHLDEIYIAPITPACACV